MVLAYRVEAGALVPDAPELWSSVQLADTGVIPNYDVAPDGRSIAALVPFAATEQPPRDRVTLIPNFLSELPGRLSAMKQRTP